jgi:hypothetical protein
MRSGGTTRGKRASYAGYFGRFCPLLYHCPVPQSRAASSYKAIGLETCIAAAGHQPENTRRVVVTNRQSGWS